MFDAFTIAVVGGTFLLAGTVKGVVGLGLPTVSLALLSVSLGLTEAMSLLLVPSFVTNLWQALAGGQGTMVLKRIWPFLVLATLSVWIGAQALTQVDLSLLLALLGVVLMVYAMISLSGFQLNLNRQQSRWAGPVIGVINGVLTGMTGSFVVPGVMYLQAIGLARDQLIQAMGMLFTLSTLALGIVLLDKGLLSTELSMMSAVALVPALVGMVVGQSLRKHLSEQIFKRVFYVSIFALGFYIVVRALV